MIITPNQNPPRRSSWEPVDLEPYFDDIDLDPVSTQEHRERKGQFRALVGELPQMPNLEVLKGLHRRGAKFRVRRSSESENYDDGIETTDCPLCGYMTAQIDVTANALGDSIWCENGCEEENVAQAIKRLAAAPYCPNAGDRSHVSQHCPKCIQTQQWARKEAARDTDDVGGVAERFPLADIAALVDPERPQRVWFVSELIPESEHVSIVAPAGDGKSLLLLALVVAAGSGCQEFLGRDLHLGSGKKILYIDMENSDDDHSERFRSLGVTPENAPAVAERLLLASMPRMGGLDTPEGANQLMEALDHFEIGRGDVLILDSLQRLTEGEENSNDTMRLLYQYASAELKRRGITVIRTDNTGHDTKRARGASAKRDDVGISWRLRQVGGAGSETFKLEPLKRRTSGTSDTLTFRRVVDDEGLLRFIPETLVTDSIDKEEEILKLLEELGVPADCGQNKAYERFREAKKTAEVNGKPFPHWMTQARVHRVQAGRHTVATHDITEAPDSDISEVNE